MSVFAAWILFLKTKVSQALATVGLGAMLLAGSSLFLARPAECFVGEWKIEKSSGFPRAGSINLRSDGSAQVTELETAEYRAIWKAYGEYLQLSLVSQRRPDLEPAVDPGITWTVRWRILEQTPDTLRLFGPINSQGPSSEILLKR